MNDEQRKAYEVIKLAIEDARQLLSKEQLSDAIVSGLWAWGFLEGGMPQACIDLASAIAEHSGRPVKVDDLTR